MSLFKIQEHNLPTSYIREYARSLADEDNDDLRQSVKQYTPLDNLSPQPGDVTIIAAHANGFPKELYEPLWDDLYHDLKAQGVKIRHIFIADVFNQGQSGVLNEKILGNDPAWFDTPRDYLLFINHFRSEIKQPILGIGHSMGGVNLVNLSNMHPRLFTAMALIDPPLQRQQPPIGTRSVAQASVVRRELWPSRAAAEAGFKKSKFYARWDPRVVERFVKYGLRDLPTHIFPDPKGPGEVTLATTKHQEVLSFIRAGVESKDGPAPYEQPGLPRHVTHPDIDETEAPGQMYYRPELAHAFKRLEFLRPSILWIFADQSHLSSEELMADKLAVAGTGVGGNGGVKAGRVKSVLMKGEGHLVPMEDVKGVAKNLTEFFVPELKRFAEETAFVKVDWDRVPKDKKSLMSQGYIEGLTTRKSSKI